MIRARKSVHFFIITKRVLRIGACLPPDWGEGWGNVSIGATAENQKRLDQRLDEFLALPLKHRFLICEPMLGNIDAEKYLATGKIQRVIAGGESGPEARELDYGWVLNLREQCLRTRTDFVFKQTGANFIKDGKRYRLERALQMPQARRARIDLSWEKNDEGGTRMG